MSRRYDEGLEAEVLEPSYSLHLRPRTCKLPFAVRMGRMSNYKFTEDMRGNGWYSCTDWSTPSRLPFRVHPKYGCFASYHRKGERDAIKSTCSRGRCMHVAELLVHLQDCTPIQPDAPSFNFRGRFQVTRGNY